MKIFLVVFAAVFVLASLGITLTPKVIKAEKSKDIKSDSASIWRLITHVENQHEWREDIKEVRLIEGGRDAPLRWTEITTTGTEINFVTEDIVVDSVWKISFSSHFMQGKWRGTLEASGVGTHKNIRAHRQSRNGWRRFLHRV